MIEFLTLAATRVIALTTGYIAHRANSISHAAMKLEADKLLIDWWHGRPASCRGRFRCAF